MRKVFTISTMGIAAFAFLAYVGYRVNKARAEQEGDYLLLQNVESLSRSETSASRITCYSQFDGIDSYKATKTVYKCSPCGEEVLCVKALDSGKCKPYKNNRDSWHYGNQCQESYCLLISCLQKPYETYSSKEGILDSPRFRRKPHRMRKKRHPYSLRP